MSRKKDSFFLANKNENKQIKPKLEYKNKRQEEFMKNRDVVEKTNEGKKPFDKKTYRLKKYSKKYKLEQWEEQRKKKLLQDYYKDVKNDPDVGTYKPKSFDEDVVDSNQTNVGRFVRHPDLIEKQEKIKNNQNNRTNKDPFTKAKEKYNQIKQEKLNKRQEMEKSKEEKRQKIQEYKKKKQERFKKLSKKTKKGQPVMTGRLELLLDKIQKG